MSGIVSHEIKNLREYTEDVGDIKCSESQCIVVEIFFVINTKTKLNNGKNTDQSLSKGNVDKNNMERGTLYPVYTVPGIVLPVLSL